MLERAACGPDNHRVREGRIVEDVAKANRRLRSLERQTDQARQELHAALKRAHRAGVSLRTLAELTGLSAARIHQIVSKPEGR
jgi:lambda repressor-like predicted transcriptional regulator